MPDAPAPKQYPYPAGIERETYGPLGEVEQEPGYAELHCKSNFSFLRGASHPEELVDRAAELGYGALAVTDRNSLAGAVRMHLAAKQRGLKLVIGAEIVPVDAPPVVLLAPTRVAYGRLSRLITVGRRRVIKGDCCITFDDIAARSGGLIALCIPRDLDGRQEGGTRESAEKTPVPFLHRYREVFGHRGYLAAELCYGGQDEMELARLGRLSRETALPLVAANEVHYHVPERRYLHDVLTCIRHQCTIHAGGRRLLANARRHLLEPQDVVRRLASCPEAVGRAVAIAAQCTFSLDELHYEYPKELCPDGLSPIEYLSELTWAGARQRYAGQIPAAVRKTLEHELALIHELGYEPYFLTVWDLVRFARSRGILCQGRGSAANSAVCYCLGITAVDPVKIDLLFERFVSHERNEPPDIDVDFEHQRREEVIQYIYEKYGRDRAAITAEVITYRPRSAIRDVGKALGLSLDCVDSLAKRLDWWDRAPLPEQTIREAGLDPNDRMLRMLVRLVRQLVGFPRHLSQHVGGFVITQGPLCETVPIENGAMPGRTFIEWDKDDLEALGMLKVDCLALGMLSCIGKCFELVNSSESSCTAAELSLATIPAEDPAVYNMICTADTVGVFQIESRAQMSMLPRLRPRNYYDLVIEVAIVRPGPIQGGMVHPYLRRRKGEEPVTYPHQALEEVLGKTLGVPLFQEQVMRLAVVAAGFTPGEADQLRRAMGAWRRNGRLGQFRSKLVEGMTARGYAQDFAERCFKQISGFGEYGFPESHAASFALLVYVSAWLKRYYPAAFAAALLNSQPMGFYAAAQIVRDVQNHGVCVLPPDVNYSAYDCTLEWPGKGIEASTSGRGSQDSDPRTWGSNGPALRLGLRLVRGLSAEKVRGIETARREGPRASLQALAWREDVSRETLLRLAAADAFGSLGLDRREALWQVLALEDEPGLFRGLEPDETRPTLPLVDVTERVIQDYDTMGLSLTAHPMALVRKDLEAIGVQPNVILKRARQGTRMAVSGLVLVRQRPGTANGVVFMTLEDETGTANLMVRPRVWERWRYVARSSVALVAEGLVERQGEVVHVKVNRLANLAEGLSQLRSKSRDFH